MKYNKLGYSLFLMMGLFVFLFSCKQNKQKDENSGEVPLFETAEFKDFYEKFSTDSVFQMEHIVFPLEGIRAPVDGNDTLGLAYQWPKEEWQIHSTFDDANGTFSIERLDLAGKMVIEIISDESGLFTMERRFAKLADGWNLIYYKEMGKYK